MATILCVDEDPTVSALAENSLRELSHEPVLAASVEEALAVLGREPIDLVIADHAVTTPAGLDVLDTLKQQGWDVPLIIMTAYSSVEQAVASMRRGAVDYLTKPLRQETLRIAVNNALELDRLRRENSEIRREITKLRGARVIVGESSPIRHVLETISTVAPTRATVLLEGESGTGKELFARAVHERSPRAAMPFITVNCAALPEGLVESTLFGHERGAFTGATQRMHGAFERAHRGTLLLDEISEMRLDLQSKLLRAIQEQEFERVGGHQPIQVDVRIIATTNRDLRAEVEAGRFRRDLYYRLHVVPVRTPPLREHVDDIPPLVQHFVQQVAAQLGVKPPVVDDDTMNALMRRTWPGNVRELANAVERAVILCRTGRLVPASFGLQVAAPLPEPHFTSAGVEMRSAPVTSDESAAIDLNLKVLEQRTIERALSATGGHRTRAAELLGISERTLRNKLNPRPVVQN